MTNLTFRTRLSSIITPTYKIYPQMIEMMEGTPITWNNKCVGYINKVDIENNECYGLLFIDKLMPWFTQNGDEITSLTIEI